MSQLQCVVVTPEQTELDVTADAITLPMYDGEMGILKGHSPLLGRLGFGVLRIRNTDRTDSYFVDGGLVQVRSDVISVLTDKLTPLSEINKQMAEQEMRDARAMPTDTPEQKAAREKAVARARALLRIAR